MSEFESADGQISSYEVVLQDNVLNSLNGILSITVTLPPSTKLQAIVQD